MKKTTKSGKNVNVVMKRTFGCPGPAQTVVLYYIFQSQTYTIIMSKDLITECSKCGKRFKNWRYATPCCSGLSLIVDENDKRTSKVFISTLVKPKNFSYGDSPKTTL